MIRRTETILRAAVIGAFCLPVIASVVRAVAAPTAHAADPTRPADVALLQASGDTVSGGVLDLVANLFGGAGRLLETAMELVMDVLRGMLTPGFIVIGSLGAIVLFYGFYYILLAALAQWAFWWVVIPAAIGVAVCFGIRNARLRRLHEAVLAAARSAMSEASDSPWSHT